jgi:lipopolysaccharide transport system permease protein
MGKELRELFIYKDLLKQLVVRDIKVRYRNSVLGFFWSLGNPLLQVATITVVVKYVLRLDIPNYSAYLLVAYLPWTYFQMALMDSAHVILLHRDLLRKVYFPRAVLPLSVVLSNLIHFALAMVVFFAYLLFYYFFLNGAPIMASALMLPVLVLMQTLLITGFAFFICTLNVFYEDTKYLLAVLLNVLFYLTPVMYPAELVYSRLPEAHRDLLYKLYMLLPMNTLVDAYRKTLLPPFDSATSSATTTGILHGGIRGIDVHSLPMDYGMLAVAAVVCGLVALAGYRYFIARSWIFAERA